MSTLNGKTIAILATHGFEQSELEGPRDRLRDAGAEVHIVSPEEGEIRGWKGGDWGSPVAVDKVLGNVSEGDYDALVLPGGQMNPDILRMNEDALALVRAFHEAGKTIGAICHAPWLLVETGIAKGRQMTSWPSVATDVRNAGATWVDREVVADQGIVTSRNPDDVPAFSDKIIEEISEGLHQRAA